VPSKWHGGCHPKQRGCATGDIAVGSLTETESHLKAARRHGYVGVEDYKELLFLIRRARTATIRLKAYLRRTLTPD